MFFTYILYNNKINKHYIGSTNDINRRITEHNRHQTKSTNKEGKWELVYLEKFNTNIEARQRELKIKSYKGGNAFRRLMAGVIHW